MQAPSPRFRRLLIPLANTVLLAHGRVSDGVKSNPCTTVQPLPKVKSLTNFFLRTSSSNRLIFHMWEEKGLKFDLALKETEVFRLCAKQRREKNHIERDLRKMTSQELLTQETRIFCRYGRRHPDRARGHAEATVTGGQLFALASS